MDEPFEFMLAIGCPDCGIVVVTADVFDGDLPVSGPCPECGDRLYFAES